MLRLHGGGLNASRVAPEPDTGTPTDTPETLQWQDANALFKRIDADQNGFISLDEMKAALHESGYAPEVATSIMGEFDADKDSQISFEEWRRGFYSSSLVQVKQPVGEDFADLFEDGRRDGFAVKDSGRPPLRSRCDDSIVMSDVLLWRPLVAHMGSHCCACTAMAPTRAVATSTTHAAT